MNQTKKLIVSYGEVLWDLLPSGAVLGGAPGNLAYRINSLGDHGLIVSRLGRDQLGRTAFEQLVRLGMDTSYLQWDEQFPTGTVQVQLDQSGNPDFFIVPEVAYDQIECSDTLLELARRSDCLCFGTLVQRGQKSRSTLRQILDAAPNTLKFLDLNLRKDCHSPESITHSLEYADILKLNEPEAQYLASLFQLPTASLIKIGREIIGRWQLSHCLITLSERGALAMSAEGEMNYVPGYRMAVADTCGSGDAFSAGFLRGFLHGDSLSQCTRVGNALGALVATQRGATEPVSPDDLSVFLENEPERVVDSALGQSGNA